MKDFQSTIRTVYRDGRAKCVVNVTRDGERFSTMYDPRNKEEEKKAALELVEFLEKTNEDDEIKVTVDPIEPIESDEPCEPAKEEKARKEETIFHKSKTDEEIEKLLNRAGNTMQDADKYIEEKYAGTREEKEQLAAKGVRFSEEALAYIGSSFPANSDMIASASALYGLHLTNVIDRLCWALDNTLDRYEKLKYRLNSWGDIQYVADVEAGKI